MKDEVRERCLKSRREKRLKEGCPNRERYQEGKGTRIINYEVREGHQKRIGDKAPKQGGVPEGKDGTRMKEWCPKREGV